MSWPTFEPGLCVDDTVEMAVQVCGKVRGRIRLSINATEQDAVQAALKEEGVNRYAEGKTIVKCIYVPSKILNLIIR